MQWITVATPPLGSIEQFDRVSAAMDEGADGLQARYAGTADGKLRIVTLWESKAHADRFFAETLEPVLAGALEPVLAGALEPVLAGALGPEPVRRPEIVGIDVARSYVREPVG